MMRDGMVYLWRSPLKRIYIFEGKRSSLNPVVFVSMCVVLLCILVSFVIVSR